jgi:NAD(P)-dependent dehydrogenase (short-subunit alcohol dehydrogenase family)
MSGKDVGMTEFAGSRVLITGGASGIGAAVANSFLEAGATVGILDREPDGAPAGAAVFTADVTDEDVVQAGVRSFCGESGVLDVLVNNAGISYPATVEQAPLEDWARIYDVNVLGMVRTTRAALPYLRRSAAPNVVNMSSCTAHTGLRNRVLYAGTKGAIEAMTRAMAADLVSEGIRVNAVSPGTVDTPFISHLVDQAPDPAAQRAVYNNRQPTGFMVSADEIAHAVMFLARPGARSTVGSVVTVDGGLATIKLFDS